VSRTIEIELEAPISAGQPLGGAIAVATDGTHDSDGAVRIGAALARRDNVAAAFLSVVEPMTFAEDEGSTPADADRLTRLAIEGREGELAAQRARTLPGDQPWPYAIHVGDRVDEIVNHARHHDASLIVLGLGSRGVLARLLHRETALRVIRTAPVPVLAVPSGAAEIPRSAVVAIDFTPASENAARVTLEVLGGHGTVYFAHATPRIAIPQAGSRPWEGPAVADVLSRLEASARRLDIPAGVQVELVSLRGEPADELLAFAAQHHVDLIATGAHGRSASGWLALGSGSSAVGRSPCCAALVAPAC
jgi:nucleotide-binding universal stress UspA family protein